MVFKSVTCLVRATPAAAAAVTSDFLLVRHTFACTGLLLAGNSAEREPVALIGARTPRG